MIPSGRSFFSFRTVKMPESSPPLVHTEYSAAASLASQFATLSVVELERRPNEDTIFCIRFEMFNQLSGAVRQADRYVFAIYSSLYRLTRLHAFFFSSSLLLR